MPYTKIDKDSKKIRKTKLHTKSKKINVESEGGIIQDYVINKNRENEYEITVDKHNKIKISEERLKELGVSIETFLKHVLSAIKNTEEQLKTVRDSEESNSDYIVPTPVTEDSQHTFAKKLFGIQSKFRTDKQEKENNESFKNWKNSHTLRTRLVIINPKEISPKDLAEIIVDASAIERLLIMNYKEINQDELKKEIKKKLQEKYNKPEDRDSIAGIEGEEAYVDMEEPSISHLMGPHLIQDDSVLDKDTLEVRFPQLFSSIDGAIYCDDDEQAAKDFLILCESVDKDIEPVRFKTSPFKHRTVSNYTYAGTTKKSLLKLLTSGKTSDEMLEEKNDNGEPEITLNPKYSSLLSEPETKSEMKHQGVDSAKHIKKTDIDKIKELILDKFLYDPHISPDLINPIISGSTSMVQVQKTNAVYKELYKNLYGKYSSSAVELMYAVTGMTRDGGSDQVQEGLAESWRYKSFFYSILGELQKQEIKEEEAILIAFSQTVDAFIGIEKLNKSIYDLERSRTGAKAYRNYSIEHVNKVIKSNEKGLKVLGAAPSVFFVSSTLLAVGVLSLFPPIGLTAGAIVFGLASASLGVDLASRAISGISMYFQKKANKKDLTKSTIASAEANLKKNQAQAKRNTLLAERKKELSKKIKLLNPENIEYETLGKIKTTSKEPLKYFFIKKGIKEVKKRWPFFGYKKIEIPLEEREEHISKESKDEIEEKINVLIKHNVGGNGKLSDNTKINQKSIKKYTRTLFSSMAKRSNLSTTEEHDKNYEKKINSAEYRSRLVIIQAPEKDEDIDILAKTVYEASPESRLLLVGLNGDKKDRLMNKIRDLLIERLRNCKNFNDLEDNETNDRKFIAHEIASILQREGKLDKIIEFNKKHSKGKEYNEEDLNFENTIIKDFIAICDDPNNLDSLKELIPDELVLKPHLFQEDNDISKETLGERYPHFEENIEEMLVLCNNDDVAKQAFISSIEIKEDSIPVFIIKSKAFEGDDTGNFHCACNSYQSYKTVLSEIGGAKSVSELVGIEKAEENTSESLSALSQNESTTKTKFKYATMSTVFSNLFNINYVKNKLSKNKDEVCKEDLEELRTILFDEALYECNMSPKKSTQTISKSDSKLAALAGDYIATSLNFNLLGLPQNIIEEVKYAIAFMALDTGVDFEDEILKNKDLYRSIFQNKKQSYLEKNIDSVRATEKAYFETLNFFIAIKNNPKLKDEKLKGDISRELAYMRVNQAMDLAKETEKKFTALPYISVTGLVMGVASVVILGIATFGGGLAIPAAVGIGSAVIGTGFYLARLGLLYSGISKNVETNKEIIPRSNFFSKDATFKIGDVFRNIKLRKDKLIVEKTKEKIVSVDKSKKSIEKNRFFKKIDERFFTEMVVMKKEMKNIMRELISDKKYDKSGILSLILRKTLSKKEWDTKSPFKLLEKGINESELEPNDKKEFIARLRNEKSENVQIDKVARRMQRRASI